MSLESCSSDPYDVADELFGQGRYEEAFRRFSALADTGSVPAQVFMGWMYQTGKGIQQDLRTAEKWYRRAAERNSPWAQFYLAGLYRKQQEYPLAIQWLEKSASQGYSPALYLLGKLYYTGEGVPLNRQKAFEYFEKAAAKGHLFAKRNIAHDMISGRRGFNRIPGGVVMLARVLWAGLKVGSREPDSELILH